MFSGQSIFSHNQKPLLQTIDIFPSLGYVSMPQQLGHGNQAYPQDLVSHSRQMPDQESMNQDSECDELCGFGQDGQIIGLNVSSLGFVVACLLCYPGSQDLALEVT